MARRVFTDAQKAQRKARVLERLANMTPEELEAWKAQQRANRRKWKKRHPETVKAQKRAWAQRWGLAHPEARQARSHATYVKRKARHRAAGKLYQATHKDRINARLREQWHDPTNAQTLHKRERQKAWQRQDLLKHPEKYRLRRRTHRLRNLEKVREQGRAQTARRRALQLGATIDDLSVAQWNEIKAAYDSRCAYCGRKMQRLTMDHIIPLSKGGQHTYSNIVPACRSCNSRKNDGAPLIPVQPLLFVTAPARKKRRAS